MRRDCRECENGAGKSCVAKESRPDCEVNSGEFIMVETVSRWGHSALLISFLLMTYAVLIVLR